MPIGNTNANANVNANADADADADAGDHESCQLFCRQLMPMPIPMT
jgi:hypothetical protein